MSILAMLIFSMCAALLGSIIRKYFSQKNPGTASVFLFNTVCSAVSLLMLLILSGFGKVSVFTCLLGCVFGAVTMLQTITLLKALEIGPMSYTYVIVSFSTVISAVSGAIFWNEQIRLSHVIGIVLMLVSFVLAVNKQSGEKAVTMRWLLLCMGAFFCSGGIGVIQKVHQSSAYKAELNEFLVVAFGLSTLISTVYLLAKRGNRPVSASAKGSAWLYMLILMVASGICAALNNQWNLYLSGVMDSVVFFPLVNGGGLVLSTLAAVLFFREKLTKSQWLGIGVGISSVIFLCAPF